MNFYKYIVVGVFFCGLVLNAGEQLSKAAAKGNIENAKLVLDSGEDINSFDGSGLTALMQAVYRDRSDMVAFLLDRGADSNVQTTSPDSGWPCKTTALMIAGYYGMDRSVAAMIQKQAKVDLQDENGMTAADHARINGKTSLLSILEQGSGGGAAVARANHTYTKDGTRRLTKKYMNVLVEEVVCPNDLAEYYPSAAMECRQSMVTRLREQGLFERVVITDSKALRDCPTLIVRIKITNMRIASLGSRIFLGVFSGRSWAQANVQMVDASTGQVEYSQDVDTSNNGWSGTFSLGATDRHLPEYLGWGLADCLLKVAQI